MHCFHALPLPEQILIAVMVNTKDEGLAVKSAGYSPHCRADFIRDKFYRADFRAAFDSVSENPELIDEPAPLSIEMVKGLAVRAFENGLPRSENICGEVLRLMWEILKVETSLK